MNIAIRFVLSIFLLGIGFGIPVQGQHCNTVEVRNANIAKNPAILDEIQRINEFTAEWSAQYANREKTNAIVTIPVVVHVLWKAASQNISLAQINSQITALNKDFRKTNSNFSSVPTAFQGIAADVEVEFCLASRDPSGNPSNGITRTQTTVNEIGATEKWYVTADGGHDAWDNSKYLNIWVCDLGPQLLGFASPPGTAVPAQSDGVVIGSQFFGTVGTAAGSAPYNLGRTATHEIGHYFNLEHVWGPTNGGCGEDDFVADTPNQFTESGGCPTFPLTDNCTASGNGINYNNYLDYSDDVCLAMFTQGQKTRMLAALNGPRAGLLTSAACSGSVAVTPGKDWGEFMQVYPNPSQNVINITLVQGQIEQKLNFVLTDMLGKTHMTFGLSQAKTIDVSQLPQGIYFLTCIEFPKATQKLLITK